MPAPLTPDSRPLTPDPSRPGRPRFLDPIKRSQLIAIVANGCGLTAAANYIGCHPRTIRRECCTDPQFREELKRAELNGQLEPINNLRAASKKHWRAAAWLLERSRPYAFCPTKSDLFTRDDLHELIDGINSVITKNHPDAHEATQLIEHIEDYLNKKSEKLLTEDPREKRRRAAHRRTPPRTTPPAPDDDWLAAATNHLSGEADEQDGAEEDLTAEGIETADSEHSPFPTPNSPLPPLTTDHGPLTTSPFAPLDLPPSGSTVTIYPLPSTPPTTDNGPPTTASSLPTAHSPQPTAHVTKLHKTPSILSRVPNANPKVSRSAPQHTRTKPTNFASPCGTPQNRDKIEKHSPRPSAPRHMYTRLPAASPASPSLATDHRPLTTASHTHHPNQPYTPIINPDAPLQSPSQMQIVPPRPKVRRFTKRRLMRRLNELEMHVHKMDMAVAQVAAMLERLAAPEQPARPIGFCPDPGERRS